jgi:hypothetical protein
MKLSLNTKLSPRTAGVLTALALASIVASQASTGPRDSEIVAPVKAEAPRVATSERTTAASVDIDVAKLSRPAHAGAVTDLFATRAQPTAAGAHAGDASGKGPDATPAGPPALPFQYLGRLIEGGKVKVFLGKDSQLYTVATGQTLENLYKVDKVSEEAVTFTYLPMGTSQTLAIPARS